MTRLRLLIATPRYWPLVGDTEQITARLADAFCDRGIEVTVLTAKWHADWPWTVRQRRTKVVRLPYSPRGGWNTFRYMRAVGRWLRANREDFDLVYVMNLKHDAYAVVGAAKGLRLPIVLRAQRASASGDCAWQTKARFGKRIRKRCVAAHAVVSTTRVGAKELIEAGYSSVTQIQHGTQELPPRSAAERFHARAALADINHDLAVAEYAPVALCVERLREGRGLPELVQAWLPIAQRWPSAKLWLVGDGSMRQTLYEQIVHVGLHHHVVMPGSFDDLVGLLQAADVYISLCPDFGATQALLDAMSAGLPILAADTPDMRELIESGVQGELFTPNDTSALAKSVSDLSETPGRGVQRGLAARRRANEEFPLARAVDAHEELFRKVMAEVL